MKSTALKKNLSTSFSFYVSFCPILFLSLYACTEITNSLIPIIFGFCIVYIYTVIFTVSFFGFISLYSIFLHTSTFFIYDCFFFTLFGDKNFLEQSFPFIYTFDESVGLIFIWVCFVSVYIMHITYCLCQKQKTKYEDVKEVSSDKNLKNAGIAMMLIFLFPVLTKGIIQFRYIQSHGYLSVFTGKKDSIHYPFWTTGSFIFFTAGFCCFLVSNPTKKYYLFFSVLYLIVYFINALKGQRGYILSVFLAIIYIAGSKYKIRFDFKKILLVFFLIMFVVIFLGSTRSNYGKDEKKNVDIPISEIVLGTLYSQTNSKAVPMLIIRGNLKYHPYPFVFSPITNLLNRRIYPSDGQTVTSAEKYNDISQVTMYNISRSAHLRGLGYGGAFLGEAYDFCGFFGVILFNILFAIFFAFCDCSHFRFKKYAIPILFFIISYIPILPRDRVFKYIMADIAKIIFAYFFVIVFSNGKYIFKFKKMKSF